MVSRFANPRWLYGAAEGSNELNKSSLVLANPALAGDLNRCDQLTWPDS